MAQIIDGRAIANQILDGLKIQIAKMDRPPVLAIILVGQNEGSVAYIRQKQKAADTIGVKIQLFTFPDTISTDELANAVQDIQLGKIGEWEQYLQAEAVKTKPNAIIVQRPLPAQIDYTKILDAIEPNMDVDGFHPNSPFAAPVAEAVLSVLQELMPKDTLATRHIVLIGTGETAGKPILHLLEIQGLQVETIHRTTQNPQAIAKMADILITATGKASLVTKDWVKPGAIVIDVGISRIEDETGKMKLSGDCDPSVAEVAGYLTPVPGGIGPINVACLMKNLVKAAG